MDAGRLPRVVGQGVQKGRHRRSHIQRSARHRRHTVSAGRLHRSRDRDHHRPQHSRRALDPRRALSAPRSGACRERHSQARNGLRARRWRRKPEQNLQNDLQNGLPSPTAKGGKSERDQLAGELGFEPRLTESESAVLPLNYSPVLSGVHKGNHPGAVRRNRRSRLKHLAALSKSSANRLGSRPIPFQVTEFAYFRGVLGLSSSAENPRYSPGRPLRAC